MSATAVTPSAVRRLTVTDLALIAAFAALISVCAILPSIKVGAGLVPITLQTFGVLLAGAVLGARRGFLAVCLYLLVGLAGVPVFSGGAAGPAVFQGPTMGYLVGFPLAAGLCGLLVHRLPRANPFLRVVLVWVCGLASSALFIHTLGMAGLVWRADLTWAQAWDIDKVFWAGDAIKNAFMAVVATSVLRAFPDLLTRRAARG
jgi:biotin transport system substrate-specific component